MNNYIRGPVLMGCLVFCMSAPRAEIPCDPGLQPVDNPALAYRERDRTRCEGFFQGPGANGHEPLTLVGIMRGEVWPMSRDTVLRLRVAGGGEKVNLRIVAIPEKTYYRLDAALSEDGVFAWRPELASRGGLETGDVGMYAYLAENPEVLLPVSLGVGGEYPRVLLRSQVKLRRLDWRYAQRRDGRCGVMGEWRTLKPSAGFGAGEPVTLVPPLAPGETICLEVAALPWESEQWLQKLWPIRRGF